MDIGWAIATIKGGGRVARAGWNGQGMWLSYSPGALALEADRFWSPANQEYARTQGGTADVRPCITLKSADGSIVMGWSPSGSDALADDWLEVT